MSEDSDLVSTMLAPVGRARFLADSFGKAVFHLPGDAEKFAGLAGWSDLNRALETHRLGPPRLRLVRGGNVIPDSRFMRSEGAISRLDAGKVSSLLDHGVTLNINFVDEIFPSVQPYADALAKALCGHVNVNLYASWRRDQGFDLHWDKHEVIVVQVAGRKQWKVFEPTKAASHRRDQDAPPAPEGEAAFDKVIESGDLLYIPRGWWHFATPLDEPSLHLTFAIAMPSTFGFLQWLAGRMLRESIGRRDIPVTGPAEEVREFEQELKHAIGRNIERGAMSDFLAQWHAERRARPQFRLPRFAGLPAGGIVAATRVRLANQRGLAPLVHLETGQTSFETGERSWPCSPETGQALARLCSTRDIAVADLAKGLGEEQRAELLRILQGLAMAGEAYCDLVGDAD